MCTGRVDLSFVLRAFSNGTDGVFIGGCHLNECHYITDGNLHALSMVEICRKLLSHIGMNPDRLRIEWLSAGEGIRFAEVMNEFSKKLTEIGPLGAGEGLEPGALKAGLEAVQRMVPYIRLVERERLRVRFDTEEAYRAWFAGDEVNRLFRELVFDKLSLHRILALLEEAPRSPGEISTALGMNPSDVSRYLNRSARQGLIRFDGGRNTVAAVRYGEAAAG